MEISLKLPDYHKYTWKKGERVKTIMICLAITGALAWFFYRSILAMIPLAAVGIYAFFQIRDEKSKQEREEFAGQFRECILAVSTLLQAGYSMENAFLECWQDMELMYGQEAPICVELNIIKRGLAINISLEALLEDMAKRSACEDIAQFARIFALAKRNGGNMAEIIKSSATLIGKRIELRQEVRMRMGGKKMELVIMEFMPFGILFYVNMGNPGYFDSLYHNLTGIAIMTGCLAVYLAAFYLGKYVLNKV